MDRATRADWRLSAAILAGALALAWAPAARAQTLEYSVKANYLVRFAAFVDWPPRAFAGPQAPVSLCVAGRDPFGAALDRAAAGQTAHGRPVAVRRLIGAEPPVGCHILYLGEGGAGEPQAMTLTVSDQAVAPRRGMIHFVIADGRVRFHIARDAAERSGLTISSRLLNLALSVQG